MNTDAELLRGIFQITRGEFDTAQGFPVPNPQPLIDRCDPLRIEAVANFWSEESLGVSGSLGESMEALLCGLNGARLPMLFLIASVPPELTVWFGVQRNRMDRDTLRGSLRGSLADVRVSKQALSNHLRFTDACSAAMMVGVPTRKISSRSGVEDDQIEFLCRGLRSRRWLYAVYADPVLPNEVMRFSNDTVLRIRDIQSTFLLKSSAADHDNRLAQRYVELLEAQYKRLEVGRSHGMWMVQAMLLAEDAVTVSRGKGLLAGAFGGAASVPQPLRVIMCKEGVGAPPTSDPLNTQELATLIRLPKEDYPGYEVIDYARFGVNVPCVGGAAQRPIEIGMVMDRGEHTGQAAAVALADLTKHAFIAGVTGSGKTNTCFSMLGQIWRAGRGVPFLVIEPAKSEYRRLLLNPDLRNLIVFTVGDETVSPIRLNPLAVPPGILIQSHIDYIKALFAASFVLYPPMPYVLEMSLQEVYCDKGWDLATNRNQRAGSATERAFPTLSDLGAKIGDVVDRMGYEERTTMDVKAGLLARVSMLCRGGGKGLMLDTRHTVPLEVLFDSPCVLELKQLVSDEEKAFMMGLLLILLYEFHEGRGASSSDSIRHVTLIEEAHRLLKNTSTEQGSEVHANPRGLAIQVFSNILAEIRSYGEGIIIAEQIPTKLAPDVIKNTNLKIVHRLVAEDDRKIVASAMNMNEAQAKHLGVLQAGDAVVFSDSLPKPVLLHVPLAQLKAKGSGDVGEEIKRVKTALQAANPSLWTNCSGCVRCATEERSSAACRLVPSVKDDREIEEGFRRLFNAMRLNKALVWDAFTDFFSACQRKADPGERGAYCIFVGFLYKDLEMRGQSAHWSHAEIERAAEFACEAAHEFRERFGREEKGVIEKAAARSLVSFKNLLERLHTVTLLPYAGCEVCVKPCVYRFDVALDLDAKVERDLKQDFFRRMIDLESSHRRAGTSQRDPSCQQM